MLNLFKFSGRLRHGLIAFNMQKNLCTSQCSALDTRQVLASKVLVSTSHDVFSNLALEDWMYEHGNFSDPSSGVLFLWRNDPCIVIGRHQNVWVECNVHNCLTSEVRIARRRSGGGTVYHDTGNLNITFFTGRQAYDRKKNLTMIAEALKQQCNLNVTVTKRDDIMLNDVYKVSGTAAKLGAKIAYHHCTLLLNADLGNISKFLRGNTGLVSKATASVRMPVANLAETAAQLTFDRTVQLLSEAYCAIHKCKAGITYINPADESVFRGIHGLRTNLDSWNWIYGHTPKFYIDQTFLCQVYDTDIRLVICAEVDHGHITSAKIDLQGFSDQNASAGTAICHNTAVALTGVRFWPKDVSDVVNMAAVASIDCDEQFVGQMRKCLLDCLITTVNGQS